MHVICVYWIIVLFGISNCYAQQKPAQSTPTIAKPAPLEDLVRSLTPIIRSLAPVLDSLAPTLQRLGPVLDELLRVLVTPMPSGPGGQMQTPLERLLKVLTAPGMLSKPANPVSSSLGVSLGGLTSETPAGNVSKPNVKSSELIGNLLQGAKSVLATTLGGKTGVPTEGVAHAARKVPRASKGPFLDNVVPDFQVNPSVGNHRTYEITTGFETGKSQSFPSPNNLPSGYLVKRLKDLMAVRESSPSEVCERKCPNIYQPVCTTSGNTYDNVCLQGCSGETFECAGACPCPLHIGLKVDQCACPLERNPVCTMDGFTLDNGCFAICLQKPIACNSKCPC